MEEVLVKGEETLLSNEQSSVVTQVSKGALYLPALALAAHTTAILHEASPTSPVRTNQVDATLGESLAQPLCIVSAITDEPQRTSSRSPSSNSRHFDALQGLLRQTYLRRRGAKESTSQRYTLAVCHHHPLCTLPTFGFTHAEPPFLALAKLPSRNTSSQLSSPLGVHLPEQ